MQLARAGLLLGFSTAARMGANFAVVKAIAHYLGPDGMGYIGQFMSAIAVSTALAGGGISMGVTKYVAQEDAADRSAGPYVRAATAIWLASSVVFFLLVALNAQALSRLLFGTPEHWPAFWGIAVCEFAIGAYNLLVAVINGKHDVSGLAAVGALGALAGAAVTCTLVVVSGFGGALWGLVLAPCAGLLFAAIVVRKKNYLSGSLRGEPVRPAHCKAVLAFSAMQLATICTMPVAQIVLRKWQAEALGWNDVGIWQGLIKLSDAWLQFTTVVLANHYFSRLAGSRDHASLHAEFRKTLAGAATVLIPAAVCIWLLRDPIVRLLFSPQFLPMQELLAPQLVGDVLRALAYVAGYVAVAKASTKLYVAAEFFQSGMLLVLAHFLIPQFGSRGVPYAYCLTYAVYFAICFGGYWRYHVVQTRNGP